jgi:6-phosphogluconolactonase
MINASSLAVLFLSNGQNNRSSAEDGMETLDNQFWVLFGAHRGGPNQIKIARFNALTGEISTPEPAAETSNPAYFILSADERFLYTCNSSDGYQPGVSGGLSAFRFDARTGVLTPINDVSSHGIDPSHLAFDRSGRHIFAANYVSGTFTIRRIAEDGSLGEETAMRQLVGSSVHPVRQTHAYAHSSVLDPSGKYVLVCDLGSDKIWVFNYDEATGALVGEPGFAQTPPGDGARHLAFHPNGRWFYVNGEMGNCVCRYDWDASTGTLSFRSRASTVPEDFEGVSTTSEMLVSDDGKHLYVTNRGHDTIVTMDIDPATGDPAAVDYVPTGGGKPRNLAFLPDRGWAIVTNHEGNNFTIYRVDSVSGRLTPHGASIPLRAPYCPRFVPIRR